MRIEIQNIEGVKRKFKDLGKQTEKILQGKLDRFGQITVNTAKRLAPTDEGHLKNSITWVTKPLEVEIVVAANYAAYIEFGTRGFAAKYVGTLPTEWQEFAAKFKGGTDGSMEEFVMRLTQWVKRKGIADRAIKYQKTSGGLKTVKNRKQQKTNDEAAAYQIALSILRKGIKPHPYLYPAVTEARKQLIESLKKL